VARHTAWNLAAVALPFAVGVLTIPVLTRELGPARFGLIGLAWAVLEYLAVFDAGLGRATVHFVARELRGAHGIPGRVVLLSLGMQTLLGALAGTALALAAPWLAGGVLHVPPELQEETRRAFQVLGATVPFVLLGLGLRGLLEAAERFDVVAAIRIPSSAATFVVPAVAALGGATVPQILLALLAVRAAACLATAILVRRVVPRIHWRARGSWAQVRGVAAFGGWVAVSNVLSPVFLLFDRAALAVLAGVAAVGFYTGPYEAVARLLVLPAALVTAVFPRVSATVGSDPAGARADGALASLYLGTTRVLATALLGLVAAAVMLAPDLLQLWLGPEYASRAGLAMRLLLVGVLVNAVSHVPFAFVQALGRPDLTARFHIVELLVHVPLTLVLVQRWSVAGAAAAWATRALLDGLLVSVAAHRLLGVRATNVFAGHWWRLLALLAAVTAASAALHALARGSPVVLLAGAAALAAAYAGIAWRALLLPGQRAVLRAALVRPR
jgi:O-antigen/teichoic acid export membrane protein